MEKESKTKNIDINNKNINNNKINLIKNIFYKNLINYSHIYLFIFSIIILNLIIGVKLYKKSVYTNNFLRLHVVANSNTIEDQIDKLKVNEKIIKYINNLNLKEKTNSEIMQILKNKNNDILKIISKTSKYTPTIKIGKINYEKKESINFDMPKGSYKSMQVILGKGEGKNIWSLVFPDKETITKLKNYETILPGISNLYIDIDNYNNSENYDENENNPQPTYSFKIMELLKNSVNK